MTYRVAISPEVLGAIDAQIVYFLHAGVSPDRIGAWFESLLGVVHSLGEIPHRFPVADAVSLAKGHEVRRVNHGDDAIFYRIDDIEHAVEIVAFRHGRQRPLS
ncbi:MAG: type II toxin-antitoxin system RelE/ParE family toxin [Phycisphaerales bacterium]|nr:MAG: type II toxin-antitoxin system RelE/ParE family toxin [Phycisphaerales bacterium]